MVCSFFQKLVPMPKMSLVTLWCLLLFSWICGAQGQGGKSCAHFLEIGEPLLISCTSKQLTTGMTIQMQVNNTFVNVTSCKLLGSPQCTDYMAPVYTTMYFDRREIDGENVYAMGIHIYGTKMNENTFRCVIDTRTLNPTCFEQFAIPTKPVCDPLTLVNSETQINITCTSDKVYPDAVMSIKVLNGRQEVYPSEGYNKEVHMDYRSPSLAFPGYNVTTATILVDLSTLEPDTYNFQPFLLPVISNTALGVDVRSEYTIMEDVVLTAPKVRLSNECPVDTYLTSGTCKCELTTQGYPPGQVRWYTKSGQVVGTENSEDMSSTLMFSQESTADLLTSYECRAETVLNVSSPSTASFTPKFPYGPNSVDLESSVVNGVFDLCQSEDYITVVVTCKVSTEDVKPGVTFTILVNNDIVVNQQNGENIDSHYFHRYSFRPSKGGSYSVECRAQNSLSSQLSPYKKLTFEVREPPPSPPVFHIPLNEPGSKVANVVLGKTIDITCKVDGGYRKVNDVTVTCGSKGRQVQGNIGTLTLEVTQSMDGQICYCTATHDSGCYDKESEVSLKVVYEDPEASKENQGSDSDQTLYIVVPVIAAVVIIALVVAIVILFMRKRRRNAGPPRSDDGYSYPKPSNADNSGYLTPCPPAYSAQNITLPKTAPPTAGITLAPGDYATVITNDEIASKREWSYNNPTFSGSNDYDRLSNVFASTSDY